MVKNEYQLLYGGASKAHYLMNEEECLVVGEKILNRAKEKAFSRGLPIYYEVAGVVIAEFADKRKFIVENQELVRPYHG
jgi:hypothetical protein